MRSLCYRALWCSQWRWCCACSPRDLFSCVVHSLFPKRVVMAYELTRRRFHDLLARYRPSSYETFGQDDARFATPMHHALKSRDRLHVALRSGLRTLSREKQTIVDFGPYPGSLLRLLRNIDFTESARLFGAGLMVSQE